MHGLCIIVADGISSFLVRRINSTHESYKNKFGWDVKKKIWNTFRKMERIN